MESKILKNFRKLTTKGFNIRPAWSSNSSELIWQRGQKGCESLFKTDSAGDSGYQIPLASRKAVAPIFSVGDERLLVSAGQAAEGECEAEGKKKIGSSSVASLIGRPKSLANFDWIWDLDSKLRVYSQKLDPDRAGVDYFPVEPSGPSVFQGEVSACKADGEARLAFTSERDGPYDLYVSRFERLGTLDAVKRHTTTLLAGYNGQASFSRDCSRLVWVAVRPETLEEAKQFKKSLEFKKMQIWTSFSDGGEPQKVFETDGYLASPRFTPDGKALLFVMSYSVDPSAREALDSGQASSPSWETGVGLGLFRLSIAPGVAPSEQPTRVISVKGPLGALEVFPAFSPDGKQLAFSLVSPERRRSDIWVADWLE